MDDTDNDLSCIFDSCIFDSWILDSWIFDEEDPETAARLDAEAQADSAAG